MNHADHRVGSVREALRRHTHEDHERLHRHSTFVALFGERLSIEDYRQLVRRLHGFYATLDQAIHRVMLGLDDGGLGFRYVSRSDPLGQDMIDLKFSNLEVEKAPRCHRVSGVVSPESIGGVLYVVEGATLGGARIDRAVRRLLGSEQPDGRRYWSWCRSESGRRWPMMIDYLERLVAEGATIGELEKGASETFQALADWLAPLDRTPTGSGLRPL